MDCSVLIVGGGVQGVGLLHDLASRGVKGLALAEQSQLAAGTSSRSTKLVHGGLRYLERLAQWPLVYEALQERGHLLRLLPELIRPLPFLLPNFKTSRPTGLVYFGLFLYDTLAGDSGLPRSHFIQKSEVLERAPYLSPRWVAQDVRSAFVFYDAQMIDDALVRVSAYSASRLGAHIWDQTKVVALEPLHNRSGGFKVTLESRGSRQEITTKMVINAAGPWNNANLLRWGFTPQVGTLLNLGTHLVFPESAWPTSQTHKHTHACLIQNGDGRILFMIPWHKSWLFGTTESVFTRPLNDLNPPEDDIRYLKEALRHATGPHIPEPSEAFCGVRTMATGLLPHQVSTPHGAPLSHWVQNPFASPFYGPQVGGGSQSISALSRESTLTSHAAGHLLSLYGGKYTTYRAQAQRLGQLVCQSLGRGGLSRTASRYAWFIDDYLREHPTGLNPQAELRHLQVG